jgi:hypothetical protein
MGQDLGAAEAGDVRGSHTGRPPAGRLATGLGRPCSDLDGGAADPADLELPASPPGDRHEEDRELLDLPHARPLRGVAAARAGADLPGAQVLLLGAEAEEEEHAASLGSRPQRRPARVSTWPTALHRPPPAASGFGVPVRGGVTGMGVRETTPVPECDWPRPGTLLTRGGSALERVEAHPSTRQ